MATCYQTPVAVALALIYEFSLTANRAFSMNSSQVSVIFLSSGIKIAPMKVMIQVFSLFSFPAVNFNPLEENLKAIFFDVRRVELHSANVVETSGKLGQAT